MPHGQGGEGREEESPTALDKRTPHEFTIQDVPPQSRLKGAK